MKTEMYCWLENREKKVLPSTEEFERWLDPFHRHARELGIPIVHVQHWQRYGGIDDARSRQWNRGANWRVLYELYLPPNDLMLEHSWEGTKWLDLMVEEDPERD